jgi:hypothetical protein
MGPGTGITMHACVVETACTSSALLPPSHHACKLLFGIIIYIYSFFLKKLRLKKIFLAFNMIKINKILFNLGPPLNNCTINVISKINFKTLIKALNHDKSNYKFKV